MTHDSAPDADNPPAFARSPAWLLAAALPLSAPAWAQSASAQGAPGISIWALFRQSFDLFTVLIVLGSVLSLAIIVRSIITVRRSVVLPDESLSGIRQCIAERRWPDLQRFVVEDQGFVGRVLREALPKLKNAPGEMRQVAEVAAENEAARRFKEIELLGTLGNLGPLLGLVGTVWGMIIAFTAIGETGGQAAAAQLSTGIAKALFHTFLGLTLAIPSLLAFGVFRERLDRLCVEGTMHATDAVDAVAAAMNHHAAAPNAHARHASAAPASAAPAQAAPAPAPVPAA